MATFEEQYRKYSTSGQGQAINDLYDAKKQSQLTQLESAYQESRAEAEAARDKLPGQYRQQANDLAAQYERNRRNFNLQAEASGLNTGAASQAALAQNSAYQRDMGALRSSQAEAMAEGDRGIAESFGCELDLPATIARGDDTCQIRFVRREKKENG